MSGTKAGFKNLIAPVLIGTGQKHQISKKSSIYIQNFYDF